MLGTPPHADDLGDPPVLETRAVEPEDDAAVAVASILARARYLEEMERLSGQVGLELPRGVTACCLPCARPRFMS